MAILIFGNSDSSSFEDSNNGTVTNSNDLIRRAASPITVEGVEYDEDCPEAWRTELLEMAKFERGIPAQSGSSGRSIFLQTKTGEGVKLKGAAGYIDSAKQSQVVLPSHNTLYAGNQARHIGVRTDFAMHLVDSSPRYLHSLVGKNARQEFLAHQRLAAIQASSRPLLHGVFAEKDGSGRQTGFVAIRLPQGSIELSHLTGIPYVYAGSEGEIAPPVGGVEPMDAEKLWGFHSQVYGTIGSTRRRVLEVAGIARHSGHHGNVFLKPDKSVEFFDLDSTVDFNALNVPERSAQILRDLSADLLRSMYYLSTTFKEVGASKRLEDQTQNPIQQYLAGFFGNQAEDAEVATAAKDMTQVLQYELGRNENIALYHQRMIAALKKNDMAAFSGNKGNLMMMFYQLWPRVMAPLYTLLQRSSIGNSLQVEFKTKLTADLTRQWESVTNEFIERACRDALKM